MSLTLKQAAFVREYLVDLNATQAALRAGYSAKSAASIGEENLRKPEIKAAIEAAMAERSKRTEITQDQVLRQLWAMATADPNELIEYRRTCCRHCWGEDFLHQRTTAERAAAYRTYTEDLAKNTNPDAAVLEFDELGGVGFNARRPPNEVCPECFGEGVGTPFIKDTRTLSDAARRLYAGTKITKEGAEVRMHDQRSALVDVGRHLGMFKDKLDVDLKADLKSEVTIIELVGVRPGDNRPA